ncbi:gamma-butyrobetaine hydroxylase-like domain-containing protein [Rhodoblastus sp.]|uniref:gamma-butyrobetaine hydroxylase-like domain-containing protein n=1 Tax=Rhodoblastus sp. TaxID=1962975 RepID=UPI003F98AE29
MAAEEHWPTAIRLADQGRTLGIDFESGESFALPAEFLRVSSPSAEVQGHAASQRVTVAGKKNVAIAKAEPVGSYAVRLVFDDGHDSGFFTWEYLFDLGSRRPELWQAYLDELAAKNLHR